jgi:cytochrome c
MAMGFRFAKFAAIVIFSAGLVMVDGASGLRAQAANPCAPKAANPCAPKASAASPTRPEIDPKLILRPKGTKLFQGDHAQLVKQGEALFKSAKLSTNGMSCQGCHADNANFAASFAKAYPHEVAMTKEKGGVDQVQLDETIQFCMVVPMQAKQLRWDSRELAALTAYNAELQKAFRAESPETNVKAANPCAPNAANPCAPKK